MARIDAHHHVWRIDRGDYHWIDPDSALYRDYTLDDLRPLLTDIVDGTILVQAAPTEAETRFLLDVAEESNGLVRGVVGWVDFTAPDAAARVRALAKHRLLKGLRPMLQDIEDTYWLLSDAVRPALAAMIETGLSLDALIQPRHLAILPVLRVMHPGLQVVIDHGAKPPIASKEMDPWDRDLERVAKETPYFCKVSGLPAEAGREWLMNDIRPWFEHIVKCFGADRVMWGSDWPVLEQHGAYVRWHTICERYLFMLDLEGRAKVMGGTAERFYRLD
jgi:L-fuconolactonase